MILYILAAIVILFIVYYVIDFIDFVIKIRAIKKVFTEEFNKNYNPKVIIGKRTIGRIKQEQAKELKVEELIEVESKIYKVIGMIRNTLDNSVLILSVEEV